MNPKKIELFDPTFEKYQTKPVRGIFVDAHNEFVKVSPADYTGEFTLGNGTTVNKKEVYDTIVAAQEEARALKLSKHLLPLGADTHKIYLRTEKLGLISSYKINLILDLTCPSTELKAFTDLTTKYKTYQFLLGRIPFHSNDVNRAMNQLISRYKHARISSVFSRKRDQYPRVYVGIAMNDFVFNIQSSSNIDLDFEEDDTSVETRSSKIEIDL